MATSEDEITTDEVKVDITLGHVARHCIFHACSVIEAAIAQVSYRVECVTVCNGTARHRKGRGVGSHSRHFGIAVSLNKILYSHGYS